jgi:hypothetical protein
MNAMNEFIVAYFAVLEEVEREEKKVLSRMKWSRPGVESLETLLRDDCLLRIAINEIRTFMNTSQ